MNLVMRKSRKLHKKKKLKNNKTSLDIEAELLKIVYTLPKFKKYFLNFMKEIWNQKHIPQQ